MGKKMNLGSWQWPSCTHSKTQSFRENNIFKTLNSVFFDPNCSEIEATPESWFTNSSESASFSTESDEFLGTTEEPLMELIIKGVRSERLFFEPNHTSSSILKVEKDQENELALFFEPSEETPFEENQENELVLFFEPSKETPFEENQENEEGIQENDDGDGDEGLPFKESVALALESEDPYLDFKKSMQEMLETHGIKDWEDLQELLGWYLKVNGKINHGFIFSAFVDLLIELSIIPPPNVTTNNCISDSISTNYSSASSSFSSSSALSLVEQKEIEEEEQEKGRSSCSPLG